MGRHSAPDADGVPADAAEQASATTLDLTKRSGRHVRADRGVDDSVEESRELPVAADEAHTQRIAIIPAEPEWDPTADTDLLPLGIPEPVQPVEPVEPASRPGKPSKADKAAAKQAKGESGTRADLRILRENGAVRAQAIGAVIVAFLLYTVVMLVIGRTHDYLRWLFIPIVVAGVAVGLVLDLAHRRAQKSTSQFQ